MSDRLSLSQVAALTAYAAVMACAPAAREGDGPLPARIAGVALILYAAQIVLCASPFVIGNVPILCGPFFVSG